MGDPVGRAFVAEQVAVSAGTLERAIRASAQSQASCSADQRIAFQSFSPENCTITDLENNELFGNNLFGSLSF